MWRVTQVLARRSAWMATTAGSLRTPVPSAAARWQLWRGAPVRVRALASSTRAVAARHDDGTVPSFQASGTAGTASADRREALSRREEKRRMQQRAVAIKSLVEAGEVDRARAVLDKNGDAMMLWGAMITACCRTGRLEDAERVLESMSVQGLTPNTIVLNELMRAYIDANQVQEAARVFTSIRDRYHNTPDEYSFNIIGWAMGRINEPEKLYRIMAEMRARGHTVSLRLYDMAANCALKNDHLELAHTIIEEMVAEGGVPEENMYGRVIRAYCTRGEVKRAVELYRDMSKLYEPSFLTLNTLIDGAARIGRMDVARVFIDKMVEMRMQPDVSTFTIMVRGYAGAGEMETALEWLKLMHERDGWTPDPRAYNDVIHTCFASGRYDMAERLFDLMQENGVQPDVVNFNTMISGLIKARQPRLALKYWEEAKKRDDIEPDHVTLYVAMEGLIKAGNVDEAQEVYWSLPPDVMLSNLLMNGYVSGERFKDAEGLLSRMELVSGAVDTSTYNTLIAGYFRAGTVQKAMSTMTRMEERGILADQVTFNILIKAHAGAKRIPEVLQTLSMMKERGVEPDAHSWNTVVSAYVQMGDHEKVLKTMDYMISEGVQPNRVTYNQLMKCYSSHRLVDRVEGVVHLMKGRGVQPDIVTYNTLLSCYVKCSHYANAKTLYKWLDQSGGSEPPLDAPAPTPAKGSSSKDGAAPGSAARAAAETAAAKPIPPTTPTGEGADVAEWVPSADHYTYAIMVKMEQENKNVDAMLRIMERARQRRIAPTPSTYMRVVDECMTAMRPDDALHVLRTHRRVPPRAWIVFVNECIKRRGMSRYATEGITYIKDTLRKKRMSAEDRRHVENFIRRYASWE